MAETITISLETTTQELTLYVDQAARGPAGADGGNTFAGLDDAATVNLPTVNAPLASALAGKELVGAAATAQAFAVQRANHTGTQAHTTITGLGTFATLNNDGTATLSLSSATTASLTVSTALTLNATSYTYGTGAAAAHRTALGLGTGDTPTFSDLNLIDGTTTTLNLYNLLSGANTERLSFRWDANVARIGTLKTGTGVARDLVIETDGIERARVSAAGAWSFVGNTTVDRVIFTHLQGSVRITPDVSGIRLGSTGTNGVISWTSGTVGGSGTVQTGISGISAGLLGIGTGAAGSFAGSLKLTNIEAVGDFEASSSTKGLILKTPDGTKRYRITVDNSGALVSTLI